MKKRSLYLVLLALILCAVFLVACTGEGDPIVTTAAKQTTAKQTTTKQTTATSVTTVDPWTPMV